MVKQMIHKCVNAAQGCQLALVPYGQMQLTESQIASKKAKFSMNT